MSQTITKEKNGHKVTIDSKEEFICINTRGYELNLSFNDFEDLTNLISETMDDIILDDKKNTLLKVGLIWDEVTKQKISKELNRPVFPKDII